MRLSTSAAQDFATVFALAGEIGALHNTMENRVTFLTGKAQQLSRKAELLPPEFVKSGAGEIVRSATILVRDLEQLNRQMSRLRRLLAEKNLTGFDVKFTLWGTQYDATLYDAEELEELSESLDAELGSGKVSRAFEKPSEALASLETSVRELHVRFQVIANILRIFRDVNIPPVEKRVLGEGWEEHVKRTGHLGIADPHKPARIFSSHSKYAIEDRNPKHVVWACEASLTDFLQGRVKGTDYRYTNTSKRPFCERCHEWRKGRHNMRWCVPSNSKEIIDVCNRLEGTAPP